MSKASTTSFPKSLIFSTNVADPFPNLPHCSIKSLSNLLPIPIEVHDGCWTGANSTILPGSVIEKGCVIAAGSVVKGLLKPNRLYAGVPAKEIRQLE